LVQVHLCVNKNVKTTNLCVVIITQSEVVCEDSEECSVEETVSYIWALYRIFKKIKVLELVNCWVSHFVMTAFLIRKKQLITRQTLHHNRPVFFLEELHFSCEIDNFHATSMRRTGFTHQSLLQLYRKCATWCL
jgi:hypothetical protein